MNSRIVEGARRRCRGISETKDGDEAVLHRRVARQDCAALLCGHAALGRGRDRAVAGGRSRVDEAPAIAKLSLVQRLDLVRQPAVRLSETIPEGEDVRGALGVREDVLAPASGEGD